MEISSIFEMISIKCRRRRQVIGRDRDLLVDAYQVIREKVNIPLATGERLYTRYGFRKLLKMRAVQEMLSSHAPCHYEIVEEAFEHKIHDGVVDVPESPGWA